MNLNMNPGYRTCGPSKPKPKRCSGSSIKWLHFLLCFIHSQYFYISNIEVALCWFDGVCCLWIRDCIAHLLMLRAHGWSCLAYKLFSWGHPPDILSVLSMHYPSTILICHPGKQILHLYVTQGVIIQGLEHNVNGKRTAFQTGAFQTCGAGGSAITRSPFWATVEMSKTHDILKILDVDQVIWVGQVGLGKGRWLRLGDFQSLFVANRKRYWFIIVINEIMQLCHSFCS